MAFMVYVGKSMINIACSSLGAGRILLCASMITADGSLRAAMYKARILKYSSRLHTILLSGL